MALAYGLFLPLAAAGFGFGSGIPHLWPDGLVLFFIHLALAAIVGAITLAFMGFRPLTLFGYSIGGVIVLAAIILALAFFGIGAAIQGNLAQPTETPTLTPSLTPTATLTPTPVPPTATLTPTLNNHATLTPTYTLTPSPTPVEGRVNSNAGIVIREAPNGDSMVVSRASNGSIVQLLGESEVDNFGRTWLLVLDLNTGIRGLGPQRTVDHRHPGALTANNSLSIYPGITSAWDDSGYLPASSPTAAIISGGSCSSGGISTGISSGSGIISRSAHGSSHQLHAIEIGDHLPLQRVIVIP